MLEGEGVGVRVAGTSKKRQDGLESASERSHEADRPSSSPQVFQFPPGRHSRGDNSSRQYLGQPNRTRCYGKGGAKKVAIARPCRSPPSSASHQLRRRCVSITSPLLTATPNKPPYQPKSTCRQILTRQRMGRLRSLEEGSRLWRKICASAATRLHTPSVQPR